MTHILNCGPLTQVVKNPLDLLVADVISMFALSRSSVWIRLICFKKSLQVGISQLRLILSAMDFEMCERKDVTLHCSSCVPVS